MDIRTIVYKVFYSLIILFIFTTGQVQAQYHSDRPESEIWYMGMNDPDKPVLFM